MAVPTSTSYVAHEFVRQYYTMLHRDPTQLHRFYTKESRFTHGEAPSSKADDPVCGQEAIHEKIRSLNFRESYAKIRSVDSHSTLGGGVVIQVSGELSNAGVPMRKFTQTFVLARQAPKKYSVFNDIFRYQDEMFEEAENDDTYEENTESENGVVNEMQHPNEIDTIEENIHDVLLEPAIADVTETIPLIQDTEFRNQYSEYISQSEELKPAEDAFREAEVEEEDESKSVTSSGEEDKVTEVEQIPAEEDSSDSDVPHEETAIPAEDEAEAEVVPDVEANDEVDEAAELAQDVEAVELEEAPPAAEAPVAEQEPEPVLDLEPSKPVTWAALAGKNTPAPAAPQVNLKPAVQKPPPAKKSPNPAPQRSAPARKQDERPPPRKEPVEETKKRSGPPPDAHQIFIGNLPPTVTDADIRNIFKEYGNIVEIRLNPKNFGFVAFDGPDPPVQILNDDKQFICNNNTINIEVKRSVAQAGANRGGFRGNRGDGPRGRDFNKGGRGGGGGSGPGRPKNFGQRPRSSDGSNRTDGGRVDRKDNRGNNPREQRAPRR